MALTEQVAALTTVELTPVPTPYIRDEYQPGSWGDADGDCQNTRHEVLQRDSLDPVVLSADGCFVESGRWLDPYTGEEFTNADEVTIDHHLPLSHAHQAGAWAWDLDTKVAFTNDLDDPDALSVVGQATNQSKADNGPDAWRPLEQSAWCGYAVAWADAKLRWGLDWSEAERDAVLEMLATCDTAPSSGSYELSPIASPTSSTTAAPTTTTVAEVAGPPVIEVLSCDRRGEIVVIANTGGEAVSLRGWQLHDEFVRHSTGLGQITLEPGTSIRLLSGDAEPTGTDIKWTSQPVWNNDGDTATVRDRSGQLVSERRCG